MKTLNGITLFLLSLSHASVTITISEVGGNLVMSTDGGTLNLNARTGTSSFSEFASGINISQPAVYAGGSLGGTNSGTRHNMAAVTYSGNTFSGSSFFGSDSVSTSGSFFGVIDSTNAVFTPGSGTSQTITASSITFNSKSLSTIGWVVGNSGTWSWGSGGDADSITLTAVVPEAKQYALVLVGCMLCLVFFFKRKIPVDE